MVCHGVEMAVRIGSTVINCRDIDAMTEFWTEALHLQPSRRNPGDDFRVLRGERVNLSLQLAATPVSARDQMHLDLYADGVDDMHTEVARLVDLGATWMREELNPEDTFVVLVDPEGNQFCVCALTQF